MAVAALALCGWGQNGTKKRGRRPERTGTATTASDRPATNGRRRVRIASVRSKTASKMLPTTQSDTGAVYAAYIVFSADSAQAELFLPGNEKKPEVLDRRDLPGGGHA